MYRQQVQLQMNNSLDALHSKSFRKLAFICRNNIRQFNWFSGDEISGNINIVKDNHRENIKMKYIWCKVTWLAIDKDNRIVSLCISYVIKYNSHLKEFVRWESSVFCFPLTSLVLLHTQKNIYFCLCSYCDIIIYDTVHIKLMHY